MLGRQETPQWSSKEWNIGEVSPPTLCLRSLARGRVDQSYVFFLFLFKFPQEGKPEDRKLLPEDVFRLAFCYKKCTLLLNIEFRVDGTATNCIVPPLIYEPFIRKIQLRLESYSQDLKPLEFKDLKIHILGGIKIKRIIRTFSFWKVRIGLMVQMDLK